MLQAFLYAPAVYLVYFFTSAAALKKRVAHLAVATAVLLAVSASWCLVVDLTPAGARPYVGSSDTNSAFELALGYTGLARIFGARADLSDGLSGLVSSAGGGPGGIDEGGAPGLLPVQCAAGGAGRWLLVPRLSGYSCSFKGRRSRKNDKKSGLAALLLLAGLFVTMTAYFSISRFFHRYYLIMLAPCLAALAAVAVWEGIRMFACDKVTGKNKSRNLLLPSGIVLTAAVQIYFLTRYYAAYSRPLVWIIGIGAGLSAAGFILLKALGKENRRLAAAAAAIGILGLLAAPAYWAYAPIQYGSSASLPYAGPGDVTRQLPARRAGRHVPAGSRRQFPG
jgi:4-amino-4-deoxy-L-arabinose transferase-like glycosyltransferase